MPPRRVRPDTGTGRVLRRLRWPVVALWIVLMMLLHPLAGTLYRVTDDSAAANLPSDAPSTRVAAILAHAGMSRNGQPNTSDSLAVVLTRAAGLTRRDDETAAAALAAVRRLAGRLPALSMPGSVQRSTDADAAIFTDAVTSPALDAAATDESTVVAVRRAVDAAISRDPGLRMGLTGAAAVTADGGTTSQTALLVTALIVVGVVLLIVYGSLVIAIFPLIGALAGIVIAQAAAHGLGSAGLTVSSLSTSILIVLAFGLASDYALLLIHRYRSELAHWAAAEDAMASALRRTVPTLVASAATVGCAMTCLLAASSASMRGLGPIGVVAVAGALVAETTFLPALLLIVGRNAFWPRRPNVTDERKTSTAWAVVGSAVARHPVRAGVAVLALLGAAATGLAAFHPDDDPLHNLRDRAGSVAAARLIATHFGAGVIAPLTVLAHPDEVAAAQTAAQTSADVAAVRPSVSIDGLRSFTVTLSTDPYGTAGSSAIADLRQRLDQAAPGTLVGGDAAIRYDLRQAAMRDARLLIPLILLAILLVITALLRSVLAPLVLVLTTALSFAASFGLANAVWRFVFGFGGVESQLPLYVFVFMVALGVDYSVFLAARIREEAEAFGNTAGITRGLTATGGVITAAGVVLAATFAALAERPLVDVSEVGTAIAVGVLLDTLIIRTVLVPAAFLLAGERVWWPGRPGTHRRGRR